MNQNPLTDPTSFIAYRLATGDSSLKTKPAHAASSKAGAESAGIVALAFVIGVIIAVTVLLR